MRGWRCPVARESTRCASFANSRASHPKESVASPEGHRVVRWNVTSCCRNARCSKTNFQLPRSANVNARTTAMTAAAAGKSWLRSVRNQSGRVFGDRYAASNATNCLFLNLCYREQRSASSTTPRVTTSRYLIVIVSCRYKTGFSARSAVTCASRVRWPRHDSGIVRGGHG
jgi:hypothetical protein